MSTTNTPVINNVDRYIEFWNLTPEMQLQRGDEIFAETIRYAAPNAVLTSVEAMAEFTNEFANHFASYEFRSRAEPQFHNNHARVKWELVVGENSFAEGSDILSFDDDGQIVKVVTFIDRAPAQNQ